LFGYRLIYFSLIDNSSYKLTDSLYDCLSLIVRDFIKKPVAEVNIDKAETLSTKGI